MVTVGGLTKDQLCVVHATKYIPKTHDDGVKIFTTFDALGGFSQTSETFTFRNSIHTSLNGVVGWNNGGDWSDMGIVVVSPLQHVIEKNGPPTGFCTVDTYWTFDEADGLNLQDFYLVQPDSERRLPEESFIKVDGQNIFYKTNFTPNERLEFFRNFLVQGHYAYKGHYAYNRYIQNEDLKENVIYQFLVSLQDRGIIELNDNYLESESDFDHLEKLMLSENSEYQEAIDAVITMTLRNYAAHRALTIYSAPVKSIGNDYWTDKDQNTGEEEMCESLEALNFGKHVYHPQYKLEGMINGTTLMGVRPRATKSEIEDFINENEAGLSRQSMALAKRIMESEVYQKAVLTQHADYEKKFSPKT